MAIPGNGGGGKGSRAGGAAAKGGGGGASSSSPAAGLGGTSITATDFNKAFSSSPGAGNNFVTLADFRASLGGTRATQDAAIKAMRLDGKFGLATHEGVHTSASFLANRGKINDASIHEAGSKYVYIEKRN